MAPTKELKLLDLTHHLAEIGVTEFESLDIALNMLFLAGSHSYSITRAIAREAMLRGYDGINYPSYFSLLQTGMSPVETQFGLSNRLAASHLRHEQLTAYEASKVLPNLAIFGRPIAEGRVRVVSINRLVLRQVVYDVNFGPVGYS